MEPALQHLDNQSTNQTAHASTTPQLLKLCTGLQHRPCNSSDTKKWHESGFKTMHGSSHSKEPTVLQKERLEGERFENLVLIIQLHSKSRESRLSNLHAVCSFEQQKRPPKQTQDGVCSLSILSQAPLATSWPLKKMCSTS